MKIGIIDIEMGNLYSIEKSLNTIVLTLGILSSTVAKENVLYGCAEFLRASLIDCSIFS